MGREIGMERPRCRRKRKCTKVVSYVLSYKDIGAHSEFVQLGENDYNRVKTSYAQYVLMSCVYKDDLAHSMDKRRP